MTEPKHGPREQPVDPKAKQLADYLAEVLAEDEQAKAELLAKIPRHETVCGGLMTDPL